MSRRARQHGPPHLCIGLKNDYRLPCCRVCWAPCCLLRRRVVCCVDSLSAVADPRRCGRSSSPTSTASRAFVHARSRCAQRGFVAAWSIHPSIRRHVLQQRYHGAGPLRAALRRLFGAHVCLFARATFRPLASEPHRQVAGRLARWLERVALHGACCARDSDAALSVAQPRWSRCTLR